MIRLFCIAVIAAVVMNSPWIIEGANNNCGALELYAMQTVVKPSKNNAELIGNAIVAKMVRLSDGQILAQKASEVFPYVPSSVTCGVTFWKVIFFDPPPVVDAKAAR